MAAPVDGRPSCLDVEPRTVERRRSDGARAKQRAPGLRYKSCHVTDSPSDAFVRWGSLDGGLASRARKCCE